MRSFSKRDISILIGNLIDHFDAALYSFLAPIMAPLFFPHHEPIVQLILAYSVLATSAITRPTGAFIFGTIARKYGPEFVMNCSLIGVSVGSILIALIPDYYAIGNMAPLLLIIVRSVKGIFAAGENTVAKLYIIENKSGDSAYKASYLYQSSSMIGAAMASGIAAYVVSSNNSEFWRICFAASGSIGFIAYMLRLTVSNNQYTLLKTHQSLENQHSLKHYLIPMLAVSFSTAFSHATYAIPCIVMNSLVPLISNITFAEMMELNTLLIVLDMLMIFWCGPALQKVSYTKIMLYSLVAFIVTIPIILYLLPMSSIIYVTLARIWIIFLGVIFMCPQNLFYNDISIGLIPLQNKYLTVGIANAVGAGIIGRTVPAISMWIWYKSENVLYLASYLVALAVITFICIYFSSKNTKLR